MRQRRGVTLSEARTLIDDRNIFASMMVHMGDADALVSGVTQHFPDTIRPALQIIRMREGLHKVAGCYPLITREGQLLFLADTSVNIDPTAEDLVEIALCAAQEARRFDVVPRVAMLSFSSFGSTKHPLCDKVRKAVELLHKADPTLIVDGEIMADVAVSPEILEQTYPFSSLKGGANVLIFPDLASANITYKLLTTVGGAEIARSHPHGYGSAGAFTRPRRRSGRNRECRRHRGSGRARVRAKRNTGSHEAGRAGGLSAQNSCRQSC